MPAPKAKGKWLTGSVVEDAATVIANVFEEAQRRDPGHRRTWVALVDGNSRQIDRIKAEAKKLKAKVTILVDLVHVLEYLWGSAWCFFEEGDPDAEAWVQEKALAVLEGKAGIVADPPQSHPPGTRRGEARQRRPRRRLPAQQAPLPRLPHRADQRLADRHGRDRGRVSPFGQRPNGHHRRALGPRRRRGSTEATRPPQQR